MRGLKKICVERASDDELIALPGTDLKVVFLRNAYSNTSKALLAFCFGSPEAPSRQGVKILRAKRMDMPAKRCRLLIEVNPQMFCFHFPLYLGISSQRI